MTPQKLDWKPNNQPNTKWSSEDGTITFYVDNNYKAIGTMSIDGEKIEIYMVCGPERSQEMFIYPASVLEADQIDTSLRYGYWQCDFKSEAEFVATVKEFPFFEKDYKLRFYRIDE